jgi:glutamine phosphoribosylpyrophosphate amidotransferase
MMGVLFSCAGISMFNNNNSNMGHSRNMLHGTFREQSMNNQGTNYRGIGGRTPRTGFQVVKCVSNYVALYIVEILIGVLSNLQLKLYM